MSRFPSFLLWQNQIVILPFIVQPESIFSPVCFLERYFFSFLKAFRKSYASPISKSLWPVVESLKNHKPTYYNCVQNCMHIICCNWDKRGAIANFTERMQDDDDKKGLKYLLEMKNERSKPFPMAKANAFFSRYKRLLMMGAQLSLA